MAKVLDQELQLVTFKMGNEEYGLLIEKVREINRVSEIVKVPKSPRYVEGIINLRGTVTPIIDLRKRFDLEAKGDKEEERIIVVEISGATMGLIVDSVSEVMRISSTKIDDVPPTISGLDSQFLTGVAKINDRLIILLDIEKILSAKEIHNLEKLK